MDEYDRNHMDTSGPAEGGAEGEEGAASVSDLDKTSMRAAIEVFERTFMKGLWGSIRCVSLQ